MNETRVTLTPDELAAFIRKLDAWATTLQANERAFLDQMLADAADAANEDASGYANLSSVVASDDVSGYTLDGSSPLGSAIAGYAAGVARDEVELSDLAFITEMQYPG